MRLRRTPAGEYDLRDHAALSPAFPRPTRACVARQANHASGWSSTRCKNILLLFSPKSAALLRPSHRQEGRSRSSRTRGGMRWTRRAATDECGSKRTAKSCGSDVAVLALRPGEAKLLWDNGGKRAVLREEHEVSRKAIAQGRPECSRCPVCSCAALAMRKSAHETAGAASTRSSLRPLTRGREFSSKPRAQCAARSRASYSAVIIRAGG